MPSILHLLLCTALAASTLVGCGHPRSLSAETTALLRAAAETPEAGASTIYTGAVRARAGGEEVLYRYERRVSEVSDGLRSVHLTRAASGEPVVLHAAVHTEDYRLLFFEEVHAQEGLEGRVSVASDGTASFHSTVGGRERQRLEGPGAPLQVGPTLFGHVLAHEEELRAGASLPIRFVVLSRGRSYPFTLRQVDAPEEGGQAGELVVEMRPTSLLLAWSLPSTVLVFDPTGKVRTYAGQVPPHAVGGRQAGGPLDARVSYSHEAAAYR